MSDQTTDLFRRARELASRNPGADDVMARIGPVLDVLEGTNVPDRDMARLVGIGRASRAIPQTLTLHPELVAGPTATERSINLQVRQTLLRTAGDELSDQTDLEAATRAFSTTMDELVERALVSSRSAIAARFPKANEIGFAVIAMGKWGARELNYASDIDLIFVHERDPNDLDGSRATALALASRLLSELSAATFDGPGLVVDPDLRPEGKLGPLSRGIEAYASYYEKWAEPWELQALIKARHAAGNTGLGKKFMDLATRVIWETGLDVDSLRGLRRLKSLSESEALPDDLKRAPGGIRDIEFTVQMLQLVHGRHDASIRKLSTLGALDALESGEYLSRAEHDELRWAYLFLRKLEHRIQLWDLRQTHRFPAEPEDRRRLAHSMGYAEADDLMNMVRQTRSATRTLHERIYFRPILESLVGSPSALLGPRRASERLTALGFRDPQSATIAVEALTKGLSRRSRAMQQMMPLMLDWLSLSPDPDLGLRQLRLLLSKSSDHSQLVSIILNDPNAGERLSMLLGTARLVGDLIDRIPEFIPRLRSEETIDAIRDREAAVQRLMGLLDSRPGTDERIGTIRRFARRSRLRIAARDVLLHPAVFETIKSLSDSADAAMIGAIRVATDGENSGFAVVAMGRWGGGELSYGSDLDLMYVFDGIEREDALSIPEQLAKILSAPSRHGEGYELDAGVRPEGKNGPLSRSVDSYAKYYEVWAEPWELLALTRARPVAGDPEVGRGFQERIEPILWREPIAPDMVQSIRNIKARVETERIGPDEDPDFHLKLGPGSLSDIEFLTQLLQLLHGFSHPSLRTPATVPALDALRDNGFIDARDHADLLASYEFCTRVRLRLHLQRGRLINSLPTDPDHLSSLASSLGYDRAVELREHYQQVTRRARRVFVQHFFD